MENKLQSAGQNSIMDNFVKTDDILKDMCGIIETSQKAMFYLQQQENRNL